MSRGIKLFKVPSQYASLAGVTSSGNAQKGDIIIVDSPTGYDGKMKVYQYTSNTEYSEITSGEYQFTDNTLVPNVTLLRKAHQDDYRTLLNTLKGIATNKFGDTLSGRFDLLNAKIQWDGTSKYALYMNSVSKILSIDFSDSINFNYIDANFTIVKRILSISSSGLNINGNQTIIGDLTVDGNSIVNTNFTVHGDVQLNQTFDVKGLSTLNNTTVGTLHADTFTSVDSTGVVTNLNADMLDGLHVSAFASYNQTHYVGTTSIQANRASGQQYLTGVSIDGSSTSCTGNSNTVSTLNYSQIIQGLGYTPNRKLIIQSGSAQAFQGTKDFDNRMYLFHYDVPFPTWGASTVYLESFISSMQMVNFAGDVNGDDTIMCDWRNWGSYVRVYVMNTEQRSASYATWLGIWTVIV